MSGIREIAPLIRLGGSAGEGREYSAEALRAVRHLKTWNHRPFREWAAIVEDCSLEELICLIKGLTVAGREFRWGGGSVASVIWLFRYLEEQQTFEVVAPVADWVIANRDNDYIPYGTIMLDLPTHVENLALKEQRKQSAAAYVVAQRLFREETARRRTLLRQQRENTRLFRGTPAHKVWLQELLQLSTLEQLQRIAEDETYSITLYPKYIAATARLDSELLKSLDRTLIDKLGAKLYGKLRGPWRKFRQALKAAKPEKSAWMS
jgi:hypothetical protein